MAAYNACRLIIGRSILKCLSNDLKLLGQSDQLCLGQKCGIEHAIHALRHEFETPQAEAMLLIDAENAFNSLNRNLALKYIEMICPSLINALRITFSFVCKRQNDTITGRNNTRRPTRNGDVRSCAATTHQFGKR